MDAFRTVHRPVAEYRRRCLQELVSWLYDSDPNGQLIIEPLLGKGAIVSLPSDYVEDHVRICRQIEPEANWFRVV